MVTVRTFNIRWVKLLVSASACFTLTVLCTGYVLSKLMSTNLVHVLDRRVDRSLGDQFSEEVQRFPDTFWHEFAPSRQSTNEHNQIILIRRPKGIDLDPKPVTLVANISLAGLGLAGTINNYAKFQLDPRKGVGEITCSKFLPDRQSSELPASRPPQCVLLGFGKCGTSALLEFLDLHPQIVTLDWEIDYFCERMYPKYDLQWYVQRMPPSYSDQITIEKSPCYIVEHDSHIRMHAMNSSLKIMVIIRDPITRLLSEYGHYYATETYWGRPAVSFEERVYNHKTKEFRTAQILKVGDYSPHFEHLLKVFPRNQILIIDGDKLVTDPLSQVRLVEEFLGLQHEVSKQDIYFDNAKGFFCMKLRNSGETKCLGKSKGRQHVQIDANFKKKLIEFFAPYNEQFFKLVGQKFDWLK